MNATLRPMGEMTAQGNPLTVLIIRSVFFVIGAYLVFKEEPLSGLVLIGWGAAVGSQFWAETPRDIGETILVLTLAYLGRGAWELIQEDGFPEILRNHKLVPFAAVAVGLVLYKISDYRARGPV